MARLGRAQPAAPILGRVPAPTVSDVSVSLTGQSLTASQGTLGPQTSVAIAGLALTGSVGTLVPATSKALTGAGLTGSVGTLTPATSVALSGAALTGSQGTVTAVTGVFVALTGQSASVSQGTLGVTRTAVLSGLQIEASHGTVSVPVAEATSPQPAGRGRRRRRHYVEIDGQYFEVADHAEAEAILLRAKALASEHAEQAVKREVKRARRRKRAVVVEAPTITASPALKSLVDQYRGDIERIYQQIAQDAEIRDLLRLRLAEEDEEEAITVLLLH